MATMFQLLKENLFFFLPYLLFLFIGGILQVNFTKTEIFLIINARYSLPADYFFQYWTHVGDGLFFIFIIILLAVVSYRKAVIAFGCFAVSTLLAQLLKRLAFANELRPKAFFEHSDLPLHFVEGVVLHSYNSFPSGHATTAFSVFCLLSIYFRNKYMGFIWFCMALLASYSRVYLSQHFFGDIYFGSMIGVITTITIYYLLNTLFNKKTREWHGKSLLNR